jgi:hypothetical protein
VATGSSGTRGVCAIDKIFYFFFLGFAVSLFRFVLPFSHPSGADWGQNGFIWLQYGQDTCGITSYVAYATV